MRKKQWRQDNLLKANAQKSKWRDKNLEKARMQNSANQKKNRAKANERNRRYAKANKELLRNKNAKWAKENPGKAVAKAARYRAQKLKATPLWVDFEKVNNAYDLAAEYRAKGINAEVDHIIPLQGKNVCGLHVQGNFQITNLLHNRAKSNIFKEI